MNVRSKALIWRTADNLFLEILHHFSLLCASSYEPIKSLFLSLWSLFLALDVWSFTLRSFSASLLPCSLFLWSGFFGGILFSSLECCYKTFSCFPIPFFHLNKRLQTLFCIFLIIGSFSGFLFQTSISLSINVNEKYDYFYWNLINHFKSILMNSNLITI